MKESSFWEYLRKRLPPEGHYSRIESEQAPGFPDVHYTLDGTSGTIELKSTKRPGAKYPFSGGDGLRKTQMEWIEEQIGASGKVCLALQCMPYILCLDAEPYFAWIHEMTLEDLQRVAAVFWKKGGKGIIPIDKLYTFLVNKP